MVRGKTDYSKGLIYKLCCKDTNIKEIYIGSTTNFRVRKRKHKQSCNNPNHIEYNTIKSKFIREHGGWENWEMILVEYYNATDRLDLRKRERYWYDELSANLNSAKPYRSVEERKKYEKEYYEENKEKMKENYENNKEKMKENYENNKEKMTCDCGTDLFKHNYKKHLKSKKHIKWFNNNS